MVTAELIKQLDECLQKYCPFIYTHYNSPLPDEEIDRYMQDLSLDTIDKADFKAIHKWKNGIDIEVQDYSADIRISIAGNFLSLKDIMPLWRDNREDEYGWRPFSLVPIIANYEGEHLLIETDKTSPYYECIYFYSPNLLYAVDTITSHHNLESLLNTIIQLFEQKAQWYNEEKKILEFDFDMVHEISRRLNPASACWVEE